MYVRARSGAAGSAVIGYDEQYFGWLWIVACYTPRELIREFLSNDRKPLVGLWASSGDSENVVRVVPRVPLISTLTRCHRISQ